MSAEEEILGMNPEEFENFQKAQDIVLSKGAIQGLFEHDFKLKYNVDFRIQILSLTKMETKIKNEVYTAVMSDSVKKYKNFVLKRTDLSKPLLNYMVIRVKNVHSTTIKTENYPIFIINDYEINEDAKCVIGNPLPFMDYDLADMTNKIYTRDKIKTEKLEEEKKIAEMKKNASLNNSNTVNSNSNTNANANTSNPSSNINDKNTNSLNNTNKNAPQNLTQNVTSKPNIPQPSAKDISNRSKILNIDAKLINSSDVDQLKKVAIPLNQLSTFTKDLVIMVRVIKITEMKSFYSNKGAGCVFSFIVLDKEGTEMQVCCFNKIAEKFNGKVKESQTYILRFGYVKNNDKKYNNIKNDFKIVLDDKSELIPVDDNGEIKHFKLDIIKIGDVLDMSVGSFVDTFGMVVEVSDIIKKSTKNGEYEMKKVYLVDESLFKIELSLWKANTRLPISVNDCILGKNLKIGDFNGKNLSSYEGSKIIINPKNIPEIEELKKKLADYKGEYQTMTTTGKKISVLSQNCQVRRIKEVLHSLSKFFNSNNNTNTRGEEALTNIKGYVFNFTKSDKYIYTGCPDSNCKKKLSESVQNKNYFCALCNVHYDNPAYYYNISVIIKDCSSEYWVDVFGSLGEKLLGIPADQYKKLLETGNEDKMNLLQRKVEYEQFMFQVKPKVESFNNTMKKKLQVINIEKIDKKKDMNRMFKIIEGEV